MGLLESEHYPPNSYSPAAFGRTDTQMPFLSVSLGTPVSVSMDPTGQDSAQKAAQPAAV
jgi:hypothetical protein